MNLLQMEKRVYGARILKRLIDRGSWETLYRRWEVYFRHPPNEGYVIISIMLMDGGT